MSELGTIIIIVLVVLIALILKKLNTLSSKVDSQNYLIKSHFELLSALIKKRKGSENVEEPVKNKPKPAQATPVKQEALDNVPEKPIPVEPEIIITQSPVKEPKVDKTEPVITPAYEGQVIREKGTAADTKYPFYPTPIPEKRTAPKPPKPPKPSFFERNPDLEKFIGENLLSKIGIVIFVIGMGFLVKLGIDNGVITEGMRVAIGVIIGGAMVGLGFYLRKSFATFSSILAGGALAVLYFTIAMAFHEYGIIPQSGAFMIMVAITAFGVMLSIAFDKKELAVLALIGGFGTPFFVSTGEGNFRVMLSYILILDIGMLALVYFKKWNIINYLAYGFTYLLFAGVYFDKFIDNEAIVRLPLFLFLTGFYLIFFLMTIIYNVKNNHKFRFGEIGILLSNSGIYFGFGFAIVSTYNDGQLNGLFTGLIAIFNFAFTFILYKRKNIDKNLLFLLIALVLTFVSLIAPIQLDGNYITLFWALEAVLLLWLSQKSGIQLMKVASILVSALMLFSLVIDWQLNYNPVGEYINLSVIANKVFTTTIVVLASLFGTGFLLKKEPNNINVLGSPISISVIKTVYSIVLVTVLFLGILIEFNYQLIRADFQYYFRSIAIGCYYFAFLIGLIAYSKWKNIDRYKPFLQVVSGLLIISYLSFYLEQISTARDIYLTTDLDVNSGYFMHYLLLILFLVIVINLTLEIHKKFGFRSLIGEKALWIIAFISVFVASAEIGHIAMISQYNPEFTLRSTYASISKSVYPIIWGISALLLMITGMRFKLKTLRIISLSLFLITLIKLFLYDLQGNSTGKIVSFIFLGVVLLLISFLYQKLKFIIQDDNEEKNTN